MQGMLSASSWDTGTRPSCEGLGAGAVPRVTIPRVTAPHKGRGRGKFSHDHGWGWERQQDEGCAGRAAQSWESFAG